MKINMAKTTMPNVTTEKLRRNMTTRKLSMTTQKLNRTTEKLNRTTQKSQHDR